MRRKLYLAGTILFLASFSLLISNLAQVGAVNGEKRNKKKFEKVSIKVVPVGPTQEESDRVASIVTQHAQVQKYLQGTRSRLLSFETFEPDVKESTATSQRRFHAVFYDYTNNRTVVADGKFNDPAVISVSMPNEQPIPNDEEFQEAVRILKSDSTFSALIRDKDLAVYQAMPLVVEVKDANTRVQRTLYVGLSPKNTADKSFHEVVGVNMITQKIARYDGGAPPTCKATTSPEGSCGPPNAGQSTTSRGTAGSYDLTVTQGDTTLWQMNITRPSASSGTRASGIEVQNVRYRGKTVMKRGHAPVLNVLYTPSTCGPYRDWQYQEDMFQTPAGSTDPAPGIRLAPSVSTTVLDTGNDTGNFRGVAIYPYNNGTPANTNDDETVLISELQAGWYRYIMEWRFGHDGTIRPRFGFGATNNSCVCDVHHHHVYWRFDMDVAGTNNKVFESWRNPDQSNAGKLKRQVMTEMKSYKFFQIKRHFIIQNAQGNEAYAIFPNHVTDGVRGGVDEAYSKGDFWFLRFKSGATPVQNEYDDGYNNTGGNGTSINIDPFINGESLDGQDVVVWYGAHFIHSDGLNLLHPDRSNNNPEVLSGLHVVGPDLRLLSW